MIHLGAERNTLTSGHIRIFIHIKIIYINKLSFLLAESKPDIVNRTVPVLGKNDFSDPLGGRSIFKRWNTEFVLSVNKHNHICILLYCSRFAKVRKKWPFGASPHFN